MLDQFGTDTLRMIFAQLDRIAYLLVGVVYGFIKDLAGTTVFGSEAISGFSTKIYGIMGLFMLFKVSFSMLNYIVEPDSFSDKSKGMGSIAKNIIIVLILIILAPFAFDLMSDAQNVILNENILERFVFGSGTNGDHIEDLSFNMNTSICEEDAHAASDGHYVALQVFKGFYQPELNHYSDEEVIGELGETDYCTSRDDVKVSDYLVYDIYTRAEPGSGDDDYYTVDYMFLWSTIVGVVLLLLFINICIEIAKRAVKLGFLELIAPIPIISFVDPKSGKDGMFKKWLKELGSTWASLFIRLGSIYFAVYIIQYVCQSIGDQSDSMYGGIWMKIFIILGCLLFAKELPKLLEKLIPGLNMSGSFTLNPLKNIRDNALGSNYISAAGAGALGFVGGGVSNAVNAFKNRDKMSLRQGIGSTVAGAFAGGAYSMQNGYRNNNIISSALSGTNGGVRRSGENRNTRSQFKQENKTWYPHDKVKDWFTDVTATRSETGTTSFIKNEINDSLRRSEDYRRDEAVASRAINDIMASDNGSRYNVFSELIKQTSESKYTKDHGIEYFYEYGPNDYDRYSKKKMQDITSQSEYKSLDAILGKLNEQLEVDKAYYEQAQKSGDSSQISMREAVYKNTEAQYQSAQRQLEEYKRSKMASESEFNAIINARTDRDVANSNQNKENFRRESLEKRQKSMKPTSSKK